MNEREVDTIYAAARHRQVQCPRCHKLVLPNCWATPFCLCAACTRELFGLELHEDGSYRLTPEREARRISSKEQAAEQERGTQAPPLHAAV